MKLSKSAWVTLGTIAVIAFCVWMCRPKYTNNIVVLNWTNEDLSPLTIALDSKMLIFDGAFWRNHIEVFPSNRDLTNASFDCSCMLRGKKHELHQPLKPPGRSGQILVVNIRESGISLDWNVFHDQEIR